MNRLKISYRLVQDSNRFVYSTSSYVQSKNRVDQQPSLSTKSALFAGSDRRKKSSMISPVENNSINRFVHSHKSGAFLVSQGHRNSGLRIYENFPKNARSFSDSSKIVPPQHLQFEGFWKDVTECAAVEFCQNTLVSLHNMTGLPWWATIILATCSVRLFVTLPLAVYQINIMAKVENLKHEMDAIVKELKEETNFAVYKFKWTEEHARETYNRSLKKQYQKLLERDNCHPMKGAVVVIVQLPMWIIISTSLRNLCYMLPYNNEHAREIYLELTTGGFSWITNLAAVDSSFALPITLAILNLTIIEMQGLMRTTEPSKIQRYLTNFFRFLVIGMVPIAAYVPAVMSLYWTSSSAFGIVQNLLLASPRVRRLARITPTDSELEEPYKHLYQNFRKRIGLKEISLPDTAKKL